MTAGFRLRHDVVSTTSFKLDLGGGGNDPTALAPQAQVSAPRPSRAESYYRPPPSNQGSYFTRSFNSNVVVVMAVLLFALVVAAFINTLARCILRRRRPQPAEDHSATEKGLDKSAIEALPVVAYGAESTKALFDPAGENDCVVCLSEFVSGEKLRLLPECHHGFHLACIDTWLCTHTTCPVCRRSLLPAAPVSCSDDSDGAELVCAAAAANRSIVGGSARLGSSRFSSARIASVDIEIESSAPNALTSAMATDPAAASSSSRPKRSFASIEAVASVIHGVGSRRFGGTGGRSQGQV